MIHSFPVFPRFFDFKTFFLGQLWGRVTQKILFAGSVLGGEGLRKWEPPVIYLYNQPDYQKRTNTASKNRPTLDIRVICKIPSKRKKNLFFDWSTILILVQLVTFKQSHTLYVVHFRCMAASTVITLFSAMLNLFFNTFSKNKIL